MHPQIIKISLDQDPEGIVRKILPETSQEGYEFMTIQPVGTSVTIGQIRELRRELQNVGAVNRIIIFHTFEKATIEAQNAMLKMLEELGTKHSFFLFTSRPESILPTIRSRCTLNAVYGVKEIMLVNAEVLDVIDNIKQGKGLSQLANPVLQTAALEDARQIFRMIIIALHTSIQEGNDWAVHASKKALELLSLSESNNINAQFSIDLWVLDAIEYAKK